MPNGLPARRATVGPDPEDLAGERILALRQIRLLGVSGRDHRSSRRRRTAAGRRGGVCWSGCPDQQPRPTDAATVEAEPDDPVVRGAGEVGEQRVLVARRQSDAQQPALPDPRRRLHARDGAEPGDLAVAVIFSSRPELRSETSAAPDFKKAIPHGTSRSSAMTPATLGLGAPVFDGRGVGLGVADSLGAAATVYRPSGTAWGSRSACWPGFRRRAGSSRPARRSRRRPSRAESSVGRSCSDCHPWSRQSAIPRRSRLGRHPGRTAPE